jgi:hypothetical protein
MNDISITVKYGIRKPSKIRRKLRRLSQQLVRCPYSIFKGEIESVFLIMTNGSVEWVSVNADQFITDRLKQCVQQTFACGRYSAVDEHTVSSLVRVKFKLEKR